MDFFFKPLLSQYTRLHTGTPCRKFAVVVVFNKTLQNCAAKYREFDFKKSPFNEHSDLHMKTATERKASGQVV